MKNFITPRTVHHTPGWGEGGDFLFSPCAPESIAISQIVRVRLLFPVQIGRVSHEPCPITEIQLSNKEWVLVAGTPEDIDRLITEASSESGSGWQPIETAPKDGTPVLLWAFVETELGGRGEKRERVLAQWGYERWSAVHQCYYSIDAVDPTHWHPLLEPPVEVQP